MNASQKQVVRKFVEYWTFQRGSEKGEDQQFWNSLLRDVLGILDVEQYIKYQVPVQLKSTTKFLDDARRPSRRPRGERPRRVDRLRPTRRSRHARPSQ